MFFPDSEVNYLIEIYSSSIIHWSYLPYCCIIWGPTYNSEINKKIHYPEKTFRIISNSPTYCHTSPIIKDIGLLNTHQHIQYHALIFIFQQQYNLLQHIYDEKFIIANKYNAHTPSLSSSMYRFMTYLFLQYTKTDLSLWSQHICANFGRVTDMLTIFIKNALMCISKNKKFELIALWLSACLNAIVLNACFLIAVYCFA